MTKPVTGDYLLSTQGLWEGSDGFSYNQALYAFGLSNLQMTQENYSSSMLELQTVIENLGVYAATQNLAMNVILLMGYLLVIPTGDQLATFQFTGSPADVFNRENLQAAVASASFACPLAPQVDFDFSTSTFEISFAIDDFNALCGNNIAVRTFDYYGPFYSGYYVSMNIDSVALSVAMAANLGYLPIAYLEEVAFSGLLLATYNTITLVDGVEFQGKQMYDIRFPGMSPIACIFYLNSGDLLACLLLLGNVYALPVLNHAGNSYTYPEYCNW